MPAAGAKADPAGNGTLRRLITLSGVSKLIDHKEPTTLDARKSIVAEFETVKTATVPAKEETRIKKLKGFEDVHLTAPGRVLTARHQLDAKFIGAPTAEVADRPAPRPAPPRPSWPQPRRWPRTSPRPIPTGQVSGPRPRSRPSMLGPIGSGPRSSWARAIGPTAS